MSDPISATREANELILALIGKHQEISLHFSTRYGPMLICLPRGELRLGADDVVAGQYCGVPLYMTTTQAARWRDYGKKIVLVTGRPTGFSLEAPTGKHFELRPEVP